MRAASALDSSSARVASPPAAAPAAATKERNWTTRRLITSGVFLAAAIFATRGAWEDIFHKAGRDEEASHIWLVPFLAAWLIWVRRDRLVRAIPSASLIGVVILAAGWAMGHWGFNHARPSAFQAGAVFTLVGTALAVLGTNVLARIWPAVLILAFCVPVPGMLRQRISAPLERETAKITTGTLALAGAPVSRVGNVIHINDHPVTVAEACNGLRMIFPLFLIVYVFCFTLPLQTWVRGLLLLTSPISAVLCNVLRLVPMVLLYGYASKETGDTFHSYSGWVMLPLAFMLLWILIKVLGAANISVLIPASTVNAERRGR